MKWALISLLLTALTFAGGQSVPAASTRAQDERAIIQQRALLKAYDSGDVKALSKIEDDSFTVAGDFGQMTKQQHLDRVRRREKPQVVSRKIDNQFQFYGDVALLTEVDHATDAEGKADFQTTILWVRRGNTWLVAHMHYSKLMDKP